MSITHQFDINKLILITRRDILSSPHMRHITPVVLPIDRIWRIRRVINKSIHASGIGARHICQVVDEGLRGCIPA